MIQIEAVLPFLNDSSAPITREFYAHAFPAALPAGHTVFAEGDACGAFAIVLEGSIRVYKVGETGREITLYRVTTGESCMLTINCIMSQRDFPALAVVDKACRAMLVPNETFRQWVHTHAPWRNYVFDLLSRRLAGVMTVVDEVAFRHMDARVAELLLRTAKTSGEPVRITHQAMASELGTSREVVSRILEDFADAGMIETGRGSVTLRSLERLRAIV